MKSPITLLVFVMFVAIAGLMNCKDDPATPEAVHVIRTNTELITDTTWKWTASVCNKPIDKDGKDGASTDLLSQYPACFTDNKYKFKGDSTLIETSNSKCSNELAQYKWAWIFTNNEKNLQTKGFNFIPRQYRDRDYTVVELTATKLSLRYSEIVGTDTFIITDTYIH